MEIDRATFYALTVRVWQLIAGPVTLVLISEYFPPAIQGWFYVFAELIALQALVELNLHHVVINLTSHEWSRLHFEDDGSFSGDAVAQSRLRSLGRFFFRWYAGIAVVYLIMIGIGGGFWMSSRSVDEAVPWIGPWMIATLCTVGSLWLSPVYFLLDGCNQIATTNRYRAIQGILANVFVWVCIASGAGLWTIVAVTGAKFLGDVFPLLGPYRQFFRTLFGQPSSTHIDYQKEIAPLQWRFAVQTGTQAIAMSSFTLVLFEYHGEFAAGQMGMTWTALKALQLGAIAWIATRVPKLGMLVSQQDYVSANRMFQRVFWVSFCLLVCGGIVAVGGVSALHWWEHPLAGRLVSRPTLAVFIACIVLNHIPLAVGLYAKAHKREPLIGLTATGNLAIALAVWFGGKSSAAAWGTAIGYFTVLSVILVPVWVWIWFRLRPRWQSPAGNPDA